MEERKMLAVLAVVQAVQCAASMFFHEPSNVVIQSGEAQNGSDFGFAMTYRNDSLSTLVVGAPKADFIGKLFNCEMEKAKYSQNIYCEEQNIEFTPSEYNAEKFPKQHFHMGSTIVATDAYIFTCAPLWTADINVTLKEGKSVLTDAFGTCFAHDAHDDTYRYQGLLEYYLKSSARKKGFKSVRSPLTIDRFAGGTGWSTLIDEENDLLLIAKTSLYGDFSYLSASDPYTDVKSLADRPTRYLPNFWNIGFGLTAGKFFSDQTVYAFSMLKKTMEGVVGRDIDAKPVTMDSVYDSGPAALKFFVGYFLKKSAVPYILTADEEVCLTPTELTETVNNAQMSFLPQQSCEKYLKQYDMFNTWRLAKGAKTFFKSISFLVYRKKSRWLSILARNRAEANSLKFIELHSRAVGTMFGTTMSAADLNLDGLDELLVGAPAQSEDECFECGALHIYTGGDMRTINEPKRLRSIFAGAYFGRFGTAIAAKDIDGDGKPAPKLFNLYVNALIEKLSSTPVGCPIDGVCVNNISYADDMVLLSASVCELVVSAPYEDRGNGAVYILSGYEVYNTLMKSQDFKSIQLSDLKLTQRIQKASYRALGFSLQFIDDVDENGCPELTASSPGSSKVLLFKCVQKINVTLSSQLIGEQIVREQDTSFTVQVCARVQLPELPADIIGNITIENSIIGEAAIVKQPNIIIDMSCYSCHRDRKNLCENVTVELTDKEPGDYTFKSKARIQNNFLSDRKMTGFNNTWVNASPYSKLDTSLEVSRHCKGNDCKPKLSFEILWSGGDTYVLGSTANETVTIKVRNEGNASYSACVWVYVNGTPVSRVDCESYHGGYRCFLPKPMKRDTEYSIDLMLNMTKPTNMPPLTLFVEVFLYEICKDGMATSVDTLTKPFILTSEAVSINGDTHKLNVTDKQILENATVYDHHEYQIRNNGSITWNNVIITVEMPKKPYINSFNISATGLRKCKTNSQTNSSSIIQECTLDILPNTTQTIIGTTEIFARRLKGYLNGRELNISSMSQLLLSERLMVSGTSLTEMKIQKEMTLASNKWLIILIAVIVALILLAILTFVLYKCGFFRRKQKQNLLVLQESVRRKSIRRNTHASAMDGPTEGLQMDVDDDCPFDEPRPVTTKDNVGLVVDDEP